jgi:2-dehydropantoate 2-reductase
VRLLRKTGLRIEPHPNVLGAQYNKLAINALGYASCLSASNFITEAVLHAPWRHAVGAPLLEECIAAYAAAGIRLARIPGVPDVFAFRRLLRWLDVPLAGTMIATVARARFDRKPIVFSLYQDLLRRKTTEIDFINAEIVRLSREHGLEAPSNVLVVELVHELERRGDGSFFTRDEVIERFKR